MKKNFFIAGKTELSILPRKNGVLSYYKPIDLQDHDKRDLVRYFNNLLTAAAQEQNPFQQDYKHQEMISFAQASGLPRQFIEYAMLAAFSVEKHQEMRTSVYEDVRGGEEYEDACIYALPMHYIDCPKGHKKLYDRLTAMIDYGELDPIISKLQRQEALTFSDISYVLAHIELGRALFNPKKPMEEDYRLLHSLMGSIKIIAESEPGFDFDEYLSRELEIDTEILTQLNAVAKSITTRSIELKSWYKNYSLEVIAEKNQAQMQLLRIESEDLGDLLSAILRTTGEQYTKLVRGWLTQEYSRVQSSLEHEELSKNPIMRLVLGDTIIFGKPMEIKRASREHLIVKILREMDPVLFKYMAGPLDELWTFERHALMVYPEVKLSELIVPDIYHHRMILLAHLHNKSKILTEHFKPIIPDVEFKSQESVSETLKSAKLFDKPLRQTLANLYEEFKLEFSTRNVTGIHNDAHWENIVGGTLIDHESFAAGPSYLDVSQALWDIHPKSGHSLNDNERMFYFRSYLDQIRELNREQKISDTEFHKEWKILQKTAIFEIMYRMTRFLTYEHLRTSPYRIKQLPFLKKCLQDLLNDV